MDPVYCEKLKAKDFDEKTITAFKEYGIKKESDMEILEEDDIQQLLETIKSGPDKRRLINYKKELKGNNNEPDEDQRLEHGKYRKIKNLNVDTDETINVVKGEKIDRRAHIDKRGRNLEVDEAENLSANTKRTITYGVSQPETESLNVAVNQEDMDVDALLPTVPLPVTESLEEQRKKVKEMA